MTRFHRRLVLFALASLLVFAACKSRRNQSPPPGYFGPPGAPPPGMAPRPGAPPQPGAPPRGPGPAPVARPPAPGALAPVYNDPLNAVNIGYMRQQSQVILRAMVAALPTAQRNAVAGIPLVVDDTVGEVNAFAACIDGRALMAISDGLMEVQSQIARARATDEVFGTRKFNTYLQFVAQNQRPKTPIARPAPGFWNQQQDVDGRKVQRQHQIFDEQVAFVLGHELAHHYLRHTGCVGRGQIGPADLNRVLSRAVPGVNQPNELASDSNGVQNVLSAGKSRPYQWTELGALLTFDFFNALKTMTPAESILFALEITHPHPQFRRPAVQQAAAQWRRNGGRQTPPSAFPIPIPIPGLGG